MKAQLFAWKWYIVMNSIIFGANAPKRPKKRQELLSFFAWAQKVYSGVKSALFNEKVHFLVGFQQKVNPSHPHLCK